MHLSTIDILLYLNAFCITAFLLFGRVYLFTNGLCFILNLAVAWMQLPHSDHRTRMPCVAKILVVDDTAERAVKDVY